MYFTLLVVVILTAIALVAVALGIARAISPRSYNSQKGRSLRMWYSYAGTVVDAIQSRLLSICYPLPDVRCGNSIFISLGCSGTRPRSVRSV